MISYREAGSGPAVVLLHGFPLSRVIWERQVERLQEKYRVLTPDLPGMGLSTPFQGDDLVTMARMADEVVALMDSLKEQRVALVGHSMGGYVALALQKAYSDRIAGLGLVSSQAGADTAEGRDGRFKLAERVTSDGVSVVAEAMGPKLFGPSVTPESTIYRDVMSIMRLSSVDGVRGALQAMADRDDMRPRLASITVPSLVVAGEHDNVIPMERAEVMAANLPHAQLVKLKCGHMPMLEEPDALGDALESWLDLVF